MVRGQNKTNKMNIDVMALGPYALVIIAGLFAHACYALSVSMLTVVTSHAIGRSAAHGKVLRLSVGYIIGSIVATLGILGIVTTIFTNLLPLNMNPAAWIVIAALAVVAGWLTLLIYYRPGKGTQLWLPRSVIERISRRVKQTKHTIGAFGIGVSMVILELPFLIAPFVLAGAVLSTLPNVEQSVGIFVYTLAASLPLIIVTILMGGGYKLSVIQRWREDNKKFLQWTSGISLILLGIYLFAIKIWGQSSL